MLRFADSQRSLWALAWVLVSAGGLLRAVEPQVPGFCDEWRFLRADQPGAQAAAFDDHSWDSVTLPHTARIEALIAGQEARQWQGICWYRKTFILPADASDKIAILRFEGAMNAADIWVNGQRAGQFMGGYLPYVMEVSRFVQPGKSNVVAVRLDNRDNPITGPKPLADLDFNLYSGLYREASLQIKGMLHITDPMLAGRTAGGGVFVTFPSVSHDRALVNIRTEVRNDDTVSRTLSLRTTLLDPGGRAVASVESSGAVLAAAATTEVVQEISVPAPKLWSPDAPALYRVRSEVTEKGRVTDSQETRVGLRRIQINADGFAINGRRMFLRGANRHQEYPYLGNAVPADAQYRDALKLKQAGFDYVRLSHYPQSPAFLDACDELGLVVMDSIMGWQYFGKDAAFADLKLKECRQLIRRDRNHPCVALWEVSLNESAMPPAFVKQANAVAHEEYPGDQCYTCGWVKGYDVFMQARQHGGCHKAGDQPCLVSEYGDWEYYAQNAGLEQDQWKDLQPAERSSRQLRGSGEARLLQQAMNFQEAHNDNLKTAAFADGVWVMYDYNRGYAPDLESSGVMDIFRLPKFGYWFFRSQRDASEQVAGAAAGPMVFIANYWTPRSPLQVRVFSNCEQVELYVNGKSVERRSPDSNRATSSLRHAPFTFQLSRFEPGTLRAVGLVGGREVARQERSTPGKVAGFTLRYDTAGRPFAARGKDAVFCYAELRDEAGTEVTTAEVPVFFGAVGEARLVGHNPVLSEAGTAAILLEADTPNPPCAVYAVCQVREQGATRILAAAASPNGGSIPPYQVCYTTDGTEPNAGSPAYSVPIKSAETLRAAIVVQGRVAASADSRPGAASTCTPTPAVTEAALR